MEAFSFLPFPNLDTNRLLLRRLLLSDCDDLFEIRSMQSVADAIQRPKAMTLKDAQNLIDRITQDLSSGNGITWAIGLKEQPKLIGTIGFWRIDRENFRAEIGYVLHPEHRRKGIMQEALIKVCAFGFEKLQLHSIEARVNSANQNSQRLLEKNKFTKEGLLKENQFYNNQFANTIIYSLLNS